MTANRLTLNSSKTEFLLIGLNSQLAKIHNSSFDTSHSARNLGFIFDEHLTFSKQSTSLSKACYSHSYVNFAVFGLTLIRQLPVPLLPLYDALSSTPNWITAILSALNSLSLNYPVSSSSRTLLLVLALKLPSHVISLLSYVLSAGSGSLNALNTSSCHLPAKFSQLPNLHTFITSSLLNVLAVLAQSLFIRHYSCTPTFIILSKNN